VNGHNLLLGGLVICIFGIAFSLVQFSQIRNLPVHKSMLEVSELIYETCKTYLITQGKFLAILWAFIAAIMVWYFSREMDAFKIGSSLSSASSASSAATRWRGSASG